MRIKDLLSEQQLDELSFMGSQCTKDCSGHRAGYKWSLDRGGVENPASYSQSFINGSNIGHRQVVNNRQTRTQGGGSIKGHQSQTANAQAKRQARAQARVNQGMHGTPDPKQTPVAENFEMDARLDSQRLLQAAKPHMTNRQWFVLNAYLDGLSIKQIADELGIKAPAANQHLSFAMSKLRSLARTMGLAADNSPATERDHWKIGRGKPHGRNDPLPLELQSQTTVDGK